LIILSIRIASLVDTIDFYHLPQADATQKKATGNKRKIALCPSERDEDYLAINKD
jgi:hypothetical protein